MSARILLIEDDPLWEDAIVKVLKNEGYEIEAASTVKEARIMLGLDSGQPGQVRFDLLIVDIRVPADLEGLRIVAELRAQYDEVAIPVKQQPRLIMSTVLNHIAVSEWQDRARWDVFLVKPYELWRLVQSVRNLLKPDGGGSSPDDD